MSYYNPTFLKAFTLSMRFEIGPHFNPTDKRTITGDISTDAAQRLCGYVNHSKDPGGETKFGIAQKRNPDLCVRDLTLNDAYRFYNELWFNCNAFELPDIVAELHFDAVINHGKRRAAKLLQQALGVKVDGIIGPVTLSEARNHDNVKVLAHRLLSRRQVFYVRLVQRRPSLVVFQKGWSNRIKALARLLVF